MAGGGIEAQTLIGDRYVLQSQIGHGGMGEVWRAQHVALNSFVAIKFLLNAGAADVGTRKRFLTEAQVTASLKTRHAVGVFDFGFTDDGLPYIVMELLEGETLGTRLARDRRVPIATAIRFLSQTARALDRAHQMGIVHRDLKPDNIVIIKDDEGLEEVKVLDFGIAKLVGQLEEKEDPATQAPIDRAHLGTFTRTGGLLGTPYYMAPEQIQGDASLGPAADIWALGVVAFECLTGELPFTGNDVPQLFHNILKGQHVKAREVAPHLPPELDDWFEKTCAHSPEYRFESARAAIAALAQVLNVASEPSTDAVVADASGSRHALGVAATVDLRQSTGKVQYAGETQALSRPNARLDSGTLAGSDAPTVKRRSVLPLVALGAVAAVVIAFFARPGRTPAPPAVTTTATGPGAVVSAVPEPHVPSAEPAQPAAASAAPMPSATASLPAAAPARTPRAQPAKTAALPAPAAEPAGNSPPPTPPASAASARAPVPQAPSAFVLPPTGL